MLIGVGAALIVSGVMFSGFMLLKRVNGFAVVAFSLASTVAGVAIANLPRIIKAGYSSGQGATVGLDFEQKAQEVRNDAADVKLMKSEIEGLAKEIQATQSRVSQSEGRVAQTEQNLLQMQNGVKQATRALVELIYYDIATRNFLGLPPKPIIDAINQRLLASEAFAYDNPAQETAAFDQINKTIRDVQPTPPPQPTPHPSPSH
jgi:hypothetical protein